MADNQDITLRDVVNHMDMKFGIVDERFKTMGRRFDAMDKRFDVMDKRFGSVESEIGKINNALQRLYEKRVALTERVDNIEEQELPAIRAHIGLAA
jgi:predicted  nucleic acid-binding Zn-ribbon protein